MMNMDKLILIFSLPLFPSSLCDRLIYRSFPLLSLSYSSLSFPLISFLAFHILPSHLHRHILTSNDQRNCWRLLHALSFVSLFDSSNCSRSGFLWPFVVLFPLLRVLLEHTFCVVAIALLSVHPEKCCIRELHRRQSILREVD